MEETPYLKYNKNKRDHDTHEDLMQARIRDRGRWASFLGLLLIVAIAGYIYERRQPKGIPYIYTVDSHGYTVSTMLRRPSEIPADDPHRVAAVRLHIMDWVSGRNRSLDREVTSQKITSALLRSQGPGLVKLKTDLLAEDVWKKLEKERVEIKMEKLPIHIPGTETWLAEWTEIVRGPTNTVLRVVDYTGSFQVTHQDSWAIGTNSYGLGIVDWSVQQAAK